MNCPNCGAENIGDNQFCNKCGANIIKTNPELMISAVTQDKSALEKNPVKFVLYFISVLLPLFGLPIGLLISLTEFDKSKKLSTNLIYVACISFIIWFCIAFLIGFVKGVSAASFNDVY